MKSISRATLMACLALVSLHAEDAQAPKPLRALMVTGGCCHDYNMQKFTITEGLAARCNFPVDWTLAHSQDAKIPIYDQGNLSDKFDIIFHNECHAGMRDVDWIDKILQPHREGVPAVVMHCNMHSYGFGRVEPYVQFLGVRSHRHGSHFPYTVEPIKDGHPILAKMGKAWKTPKGELYAVTEIMKTATPIAHALRLDGNQKDLYEVCMWTNEYEKCRVFGTTVGHHNETVETQEWLDTVARGFLWALGKLDETNFKTVARDDHEKVLISARAKASDSTPAPQAQPKKDVGTVVPNLATNKKSMASTNETGKGNVSKNAVDGNLGTRWCAAGAAYPQTWQVDLDKTEHVKGIRIHWERMAGSKYGFKVEGSKDEKEWTVLIDESKPEKNNGIATHVIDAPDTRYLRVTGLSCSSGGWCSFWEFEAFTGVIPPTEKVLINQTKGGGGSSSPVSVTVPEQFVSTQFAVPPQVSYPSALCCAPAGEVFVAVDQNGSLGKDLNVQQNILRMLDTDGDGKADKVNVFAEKVEDTTGGNKWMVFNGRGLFYDNGKLWVLHPPFIRVFEDVDGDGKADKNDLLVSGISTQQSLAGRGGDHTTNGFRVSIDGWMYIAVGDFGFDNAVDKGGKKVVLQGGGIARVRLDGTELEIYAQGLRNIYDVAVSPQLDLFTRDNTNDGGGWNVRLSHVIGGQAEYGYPRQFKKFKGEFIDCLADYGGGSPCGSIFLDEPGLGEIGRSLLTCDWGRSVVYQHPLTPNGAGFKPEQKDFIKISRPTDIDVDASGAIYVSSWHDAGFKYGKPDSGFVARIVPRDFKPLKFPDLKAATDEELVGLMATDSQVWRLHTQLELLRRGDKPVFAEGVTKLARDAQQNSSVRIAAIFTLKQLQGEKSHLTLIELARDDTVREFALRALADRLGQITDVPVQPFIDALMDKNPRVRLQAVIGLGRLGKPEAASALTKLTADSDVLVAHAAVKSLSKLEAVEASFAGVDGSDVAVRKGCLRVLYALHKPEVVTGLMQRLEKASDVEIRKDLLSALARLHFKEAEYDGGWWGTRPDSRGPYFKPTKWEQSDAILQRLMESLSDPELVPFLLVELPHNRIEIQESLNVLLNLAKEKPSFRAAAATIFLESSTVPGQGIPLLKELALDPKADTRIRVLILDGLMRTTDPRQGFSAACDIAASLKETTGDMAYAREAFLRNPAHTQHLNLVKNAAIGNDASQRSIAFAILNNIASSQLVKGKERDAIVGLVGELRSHAIPAVKKLAEKIRLETPTSDLEGKTIGELKPEDLPGIVARATGTPALGQELFMAQGCVACHTVSPNEPLKGPSLIDITRRYQQHEIIESILKPSALIAPAFATHWFQMKKGNGQEEGFVVRESGDEIEIRNIAGVSTTLKQSEIKSRGKRENSMMPEGLVQMLTPDQFASLLAYLKTLETK